MPQVAAISQQIWDMKYRLKTADGQPVDKTIEDSWRRVAQAVAEAEPEEQRQAWAAKFYEALAGFHFLPAPARHIRGVCNPSSVRRELGSRCICRDEWRWLLAGSWR